MPALLSVPLGAAGAPSVLGVVVVCVLCGAGTDVETLGVLAAVVVVLTDTTGAPFRVNAGGSGGRGAGERGALLPRGPSCELGKGARGCRKGCSGGFGRARGLSG